VIEHLRGLHAPTGIMSHQLVCRFSIVTCHDQVGMSPRTYRAQFAP